MSNESFNSNALEILNSLGEFLQLGKLEFHEEDNTCTLILDNTIEVNITRNSGEGTIVLHHVIGTLPKENRQEILEQLLEANLFWSGTSGGTISLERDSGLVILARALAIYDPDGALITGEALGNAISDFLSASNYWKKLLEHSEDPLNKSESHDQPSSESTAQPPINIALLN